MVSKMSKKKKKKVANDAFLAVDGRFPEQRRSQNVFTALRGYELRLRVSTCPPGSGNQMSQPAAAAAATAATWTSLRNASYRRQT